MKKLVKLELERLLCFVNKHLKFLAFFEEKTFWVYVCAYMHVFMCDVDACM